MKRILLIDIIIEDKSISHSAHVKEILGSKADQFKITELHLASEELNEEQLLNSDGVIFSGSYRSVYEDFEWKARMHRAFELILEKNIPTLATCFGAQFLAYHLGATVIKNPRGVEFGPVTVTMTEEGRAHPLIGDYHKEKYVFATHQDIVEAVPAGATLLAYNENTPVQAFQYGPILATQFHSDLPTERTKIMLETRKQKYLDMGLLRDDVHYLDLMDRLHLGEQSHDILHRFLESVPKRSKP